MIFISIGYGKVENGTVPMNFGPLNNEGGERRLNVLITRAKMRCEVFTNITSEDIKPTATTKFGIRALKSFLYFTQHGRFDVQSPTVAPSIRPFEDQVAEQLTAKGYTVRKKVGSEAFYLDMAIVDPSNPGRYILGIECDGESYASAQSARDRDRLRRQVLEMMGWKIFRIWSTDWFRNPKQELERLVAAIEKAKQQTQDEDAEEEELETITVSREELKQTASSVPPYVFAKLPAEVAIQELNLYSFARLAGWITEIVRVEGPIHLDEMMRRMAEAAKISKVNSRVRYTLTQASAHAQQIGAIKILTDFLWHKDMETPVIRDRSALPTASKKFQYISPEEINLAIQKVVEEAIAISPEAAVPFVARLFGFARVTEELKKDILNAITVALEMELIVEDGGFLKKA